jgi:hypothetical protein
MAHFAELDSNNIVQRVIVVGNDILKDATGQENEELGKAFCQSLLGGNWVQTSYNGNFRKMYAGIGYAYDEVRNQFVPPSWTLIDGVWTAPPVSELLLPPAPPLIEP